MKTREQEVINFLITKKVDITTQQEMRNIYPLIMKNGLIFTLDYLLNRSGKNQVNKKILDIILEWLSTKGLEIFDRNSQSEKDNLYNLSRKLTYADLRKATLECIYLLSWVRRVNGV